MHRHITLYKKPCCTYEAKFSGNTFANFYLVLPNDLTNTKVKGVLSFLPTRSYRCTWFYRRSVDETACMETLLL